HRDGEALKTSWFGRRGRPNDHRWRLPRAAVGRMEADRPVERLSVARCLADKPRVADRSATPAQVICLAVKLEGSRERKLEEEKLILRTAQVRELSLVLNPERRHVARPNRGGG